MPLDAPDSVEVPTPHAHQLPLLLLAPMAHAPSLVPFVTWTLYIFAPLGTLATLITVPDATLNVPDAGVHVPDAEPS